MTKLEALELSVKKWEDICGDIVSAYIATQCCSLCTYDNQERKYKDEYCSKCPLTAIRRGCFRSRGVWKKIRNILGGWRMEPDCRKLSEHENKDLTSLCRQMLKTIRKLRDEERKEQI